MPLCTRDPHSNLTKLTCIQWCSIALPLYHHPCTFLLTLQPFGLASISRQFRQGLPLADGMQSVNHAGAWIMYLCANTYTQPQDAPSRCLDGAGAIFERFWQDVQRAGG